MLTFEPCAGMSGFDEEYKKNPTIENLCFSLQNPRIITVGTEFRVLLAGDGNYIRFLLEEYNPATKTPELPALDIEDFA